LIAQNPEIFNTEKVKVISENFVGLTNWIFGKIVKKINLKFPLGMIDLHKNNRKYYISFQEDLHLSEDLKMHIRALDHDHLNFLKIFKLNS
jgi:hypothetical protein